MSKFRFWATLTTASILGFAGIALGTLLPLPAPYTLNQTRFIYALGGIIIGLLAFAPISSWIVKTSTSLFKQLISRLAFEIFNQFTQLTSRGRGIVFPASLASASGNDLEPYLSSLSGAVILDTSSIIDGRILEVSKAGFLSGVLLVPNFVLLELQQVADSADSIKRGRGRRGFEIIDNLKKISGVKLEVWDNDIKGKTVDEKLVRLGKMIGGKVVTCDFNLNRVARLSGVRILNLNELSNALKSLPVPGEKLQLKIIQEGKDKHQGVGYLADGTMVVVKDAGSLMGQEISAEVNKILQGPSGRMIFGKLVI